MKKVSLQTLQKLLREKGRFAPATSPSPVRGRECVVPWVLPRAHGSLPITLYEFRFARRGGVSPPATKATHHTNGRIVMRPYEKATPFAFLCLPRVLTALKHRAKEGYIYLLIRFAARQCQGVPRGNAWADFLSSFLCSATKKGHQAQIANARSSVSVRLRSSKKIS